MRGPRPHGPLDHLRVVGERIASALLPQDCVLCAAPSGDELVCRGCHADLPPLGDVCPRCADASPAGTLCGACLADPPHFDSALAVWRYDFPVDRLVHALKYGQRLALAAWFGRTLARRAQARQIDVVLPMPLHARRLRERGFNQAMEIARRIGRASGIPVDAHLAERTRDTAVQTGLSHPERVRNVRGAFSCAADLSGRVIAVVDDVMTTGATQSELAHTLKRAGAARVEAWVVARAFIEHGDD